MQRRSLADIIMDKIREKEQGEARAAGVGGDDEEEEDGMERLPPKVGELRSVCCCGNKECASCNWFFSFFFFRVRS